MSNSSPSHPMLSAFEPTAADPFDAVKAAHLLNRAGFGGTPEEVEKVRAMGPAKAADWLLDFPDKRAEERDKSDVPDLSAIAAYPSSFRDLQQMSAGKTREERMALFQKIQFANRQAVLSVSNWWLRQMAKAGTVNGVSPLQEKLTLLWHGHFTTSARDERSAVLMWNQNELLRKNAAGNFKQFVHAISRDPAMLDYLNNQQNRRGHPNENYARELMELFTLGIGNYTEQDVKEAARAFTGWGHDGPEFTYRRFFHDPGPKTFLGRTGNFDGDDVIDILFDHPACPTYVASRLYNWFVSEEPDESIARALGEAFKDGKWELRPALRMLLTSKAFYDPKAVGSQIKGPVQLVVGTVRQLAVDMPPGPALFGALDQMGQTPLMPPNVKGWPGGRSWVNASTLFVRYNTCVRLAGGDVPPAAGGPGRFGGGAGGGMRPGGGRFAGRVRFEPQGAQTADKCVDQWVGRLIQRPIEAEKRKVLVAALDDKPNDPAAVRRMVQLIVSMPEYQLC